MKIDVCEKDDNKKISIKLISETYADIALLYDIGRRIKSPVESFGGFTNDYVYLWINIPLRHGEKWGFSNDFNK